jgi:hypothetical protein
MKTRSLNVLALMALLSASSGCGAAEQAAAIESPVAASTAQMTMLQLMRAFPFPHSNVLFDTQTIDPEGTEKTASMSFSVYRWVDSDTYAGWAGVENSALALAEMAPLLLIPRACANGKPAPVEQEGWKAAVRGLVAAGEAAHMAAQSKSLDAMIEVSETISNACSACHDLYRDVDLSGGERCTPAK